MISFNWVITVPKHLTADSSTLGTSASTPSSPRSRTRSCATASTAASQTSRRPRHGEFFRIAQEYWDNLGRHGRVLEPPYRLRATRRRHGQYGPRPRHLARYRAHRSTTQFDVAQPAEFSTFRRGYRARPDGTITKLIAFGMAKDRAGIKDWYAKRFAGLGQDPLVREHVFGTTVGKTISSAMSARCRAPASSPTTGTSSSGSTPMRTRTPTWRRRRSTTCSPSCATVSTDTLAGLFRGQEMLMLNTARPHRDE